MSVVHLFRTRTSSTIYNNCRETMEGGDNLDRETMEGGDNLDRNDGREGII